MATLHTPLFEEHKKLGAKFTSFAGWEMPVQYRGVVTEHKAVRASAGLFDVSHMGELIVSGREAEKALNFLTSNDVTKLSDGKAHYSAILNESGGVVDDIIVYRFSSEKYLVCVNAANSTKDYEWLIAHNRFDAQIDDRSAEYAQIAIQGPRSEEILRNVCPDLPALSYFHFAQIELFGAPAVVARTGYTGEDGFEIFLPPALAVQLWRALLTSGEKYGIEPVGLGARDSLRLEPCYPLHGHELSDDISALESGLGWVVKFDKGEFIGRDALLKQKQAGVPRALVGFFIEDAGIARHGDRVYSNSNAVIGHVTSGTKTPTVERALGLALVSAECKAVGTEIELEVRSRRLKARVVKTPFYRRS